MNEQMDFPETFEEFAKQYGFKDDKEVYTNGSDLIHIFRVKQWLEHLLNISENPNKWIPVSERLPEDHKNVLIYLSSNQIIIGLYNSHRLPFMDKPIGWGADAPHDWSSDEVVAWIPLPEPYKPTSLEEDD